jgi:hypothetical protein
MDESLSEVPIDWSAFDGRRVVLHPDEQEKVAA